MQTSHFTYRNFISFGVVLAMFGALVFIMQSGMIQTVKRMDFAVSADLLISVPLVWFLLIRKTRVPNMTAIPVAFTGLLLGYYFMPEVGQTYLNLFKTWALPLIETGLVLYLLYKVRMAIKSYQALKSRTADFYTALKSVCSETFPAFIAPLFATELAVFYYALIKWKTGPKPTVAFTCHKGPGTSVLFGVLLFLVVVETFVVHLLVALWHPAVAWVLTGLSIYAGVQVLAYMKSIIYRPIIAENDRLVLRYGVLREAVVPLADIASVELTKKPLAEGGPVRNFSPLFDFEGHNLVLHLKNENEMEGLYGGRTRFTSLALYIDQAEQFMEHIKAPGSV